LEHLIRGMDREKDRRPRGIGSKVRTRKALPRSNLADRGNLARSNSNLKIEKL